MLIDQTQTPALILARVPGSRLHQDLHPSGSGDAQKPEAQKPAKLPNPGVAFATLSRAGTHCKPDLIARRCPIDPSQQKLEVESELQLADDHKRRPLAAQGNEIAPANLALHIKAEIFQKALYRRI